MKKSDLSSLDIHFQKIYDNIEQLLEEIDESSIPSRFDLVRALFIKQLEKLKFSDVISTTSSSLLDLNTNNISKKTSYEKILNLIELIENSPDSKDENIKEILSMIDGMSDSDKEVIKNTFLELEGDQLKTAILDIISVFVSKEK